MKTPTATKTVTFATAFEGITVQLDQAAEQPGRGAHFAGVREFMYKLTAGGSIPDSLFAALTPRGATR